MSKPKRLETASADLSYAEYVQRRNQEMAKNRPNSKKSVRSSSSGGRPGSTSSGSSSNSKNSTQPNKKNSYEFEAHEYKRNGYETFNSQLGEDPVTALRTLKNRLRTMSIATSLKDRTVKAHLCKQACDKISIAEGEMENLSHNRSQAILQGDTNKAKEVAKQMHDLRDRATYTAYTDLLLDEDQINPFGVKSNWTPDPEISEPEEEIKPPKKKEPQEFKPIRSMSERKRDREKDEKVDAKLIVKPLTPNKPTKRNARIMGGNSVDPVTGEVRGLKPGENDPFSLPNDYGICPYCEEQNPDFARGALLKRHMKETCPCLTSCDYCDKVIEVSMLNEHQLQRCKFVGDSLTACKLCGLACYKGENSHPRCRKMNAPEDSNWCPLCSIAVKPKDSKKAWSKHLKQDCYNNPRKGMGGVPDPDWELYNKQNPPVPEPVGSASNNDADKKDENSNDPNNPNGQPPLGPNGYPQYIYTTNNVTPEAIRDAFSRIKEDRRAETEQLRREEALREKAEEEAAERERKQLEQELAELARKRKEDEKKKIKKT